MATNAQNKRSLFSTSQAAQLKQRVEGDYELSVVLFTQGKYHEAYTAAVDFIDATHSLPVSMMLFCIFVVVMMVFRGKKMCSM